MDKKNLLVMTSPENTASIILRNSGCTNAEICMREQLDRTVLAEAIQLAEKQELIRKGEPRMCDITFNLSITWWPAQ